MRLRSADTPVIRCLEEEESRRWRRRGSRRWHPRLLGANHRGRIRPNKNNKQLRRGSAISGSLLLNAEIVWRSRIVHAICSRSSRTTRPPIRGERVSASCSQNAADARRLADGERARQECGGSGSQGSFASARRVHGSIPGLRALHGRVATFSSTTKERRQSPLTRQAALLFSAADRPRAALRSVITGTELESGFVSLTAQRQNDPPSLPSSLPPSLSCSAS